MGNKFEVYAWVLEDKEFSKMDPANYRWLEIYRGQDFDEAMTAMTEAKKTYSCVKLEWRETV